jgi:hypothetical protein
MAEQEQQRRYLSELPMASDGSRQSHLFFSSIDAGIIDVFTKSTLDTVLDPKVLNTGRRVGLGAAEHGGMPEWEPLPLYASWQSVDHRDFQEIILRNVRDCALELGVYKRKTEPELHADAEGITIANGYTFEAWQRAMEAAWRTKQWRPSESTLRRIAEEEKEREEKAREREKRDREESRDWMRKRYFAGW